MSQEEHTEPGPWLAAAREQAGLSLMQAADQLHLDVAAVKALEAGRFEELGAAVYARGHLRRYAELLGLPVQEVEKSFLQLHPARSAPDLRHGAGLLQKSDAGARALRPGTAVLCAVVLVIIGVVIWAKRMPHPHAAPASAAAPSASAAPKDAPAPITEALSPVMAPSMRASVPEAGSLAMPIPTADAASRFNGEPAPLWAASQAPAQAQVPATVPTKPSAKPPAHAHGSRP